MIDTIRLYPFHFKPRGESAFLADFQQRRFGSREAREVAKLLRLGV